MSGPRPLPAGPLVAFYGDDFTGSSAAMEVAAFAGLETVLFLSPPSPERLAAFASYRVIGVAGIARSQGPSPSRWRAFGAPAHGHGPPRTTAGPLSAGRWT